MSVSFSSTLDRVLRDDDGRDAHHGVRVLFLRDDDDLRIQFSVRELGLVIVIPQLADRSLQLWSEL